MAQTLEKIVRCPILLDDQNDMWNPRIARGPAASQQRTSYREFHSV